MQTKNNKKIETTKTIKESWKIILSVILIDLAVTLFILIFGNETLFLMINLDLPISILDPVLALIANFGAILLFLFGIFLFLFSSRSNSKYAFFIMIAGFWISLFVGYSLKTFFGVLRPYEQIQYTRTLIYTTDNLGDAFPSSHALISFFVWTIIAVKAKRYRYPTLVFAIITSFSRIYVGVHFPLDITMGILLGVTIASILLIIEKIFIDYRSKNLQVSEEHKI